MVAILEDGKANVLYELEDDMAELDFALGRFPSKWREAEDDEDLNNFFVCHIRRPKKSKEGPVKVPAAYDGFRTGDTVAMALGGSGDRLAFALSRRAEEIGSDVLRIPPFLLKAERGEASKDNDHVLLAGLAKSRPDLFYPVGPRDRDFIRMSEAYRARRDAQKDRIRCEQRLYQHLVGRIFLSEEGRYPEGKIEDEYDREKASDKILLNLNAEETRRESELKRAVHKLDVWGKVFSPIEGCGEVLAAGLMTSIGAIRRFEVSPDFTDASTPEERRRRENKAAKRSQAKLKAFCGVHVLEDGRFVRKRSGEVANWSPAARQSLYQLGQQFVYREDSEWGKRYREYKKILRVRHPEVIVENSKKRYTDGHIHKMAIWRTLTKFVEKLWTDWTRTEKDPASEKKAAA